jgi:hypothetical protein
MPGEGPKKTIECHTSIRGDPLPRASTNCQQLQRLTNARNLKPQMRKSKVNNNRILQQLDTHLAFMAFGFWRQTTKAVGISEQL